MGVFTHIQWRSNVDALHLPTPDMGLVESYSLPVLYIVLYIVVIQPVSYCAFRDILLQGGVVDAVVQPALLLE